MDVNNDGLNQFLDTIRDALEPYIQQTMDEFTVKVKEEYIPQLKNFVEDLLKSKNVKCESVDVLTKSDLVSFIRLNKVNGSNGIAAFKQLNDKIFLIYLAYCKDKELFPEETNCYIVIEAKSLADDVNELFKESDLIILN